MKINWEKAKFWKNGGATPKSSTTPEAAPVQQPSAPSQVPSVSSSDHYIAGIVELSDNDAVLALNRAYGYRVNGDKYELKRLSVKRSSLPVKPGRTPAVGARMNLSSNALLSYVKKSHRYAVSKGYSRKVEEDAIVDLYDGSSSSSRLELLADDSSLDDSSTIPLAESSGGGYGGLIEEALAAEENAEVIRDKKKN